MSDYPRCKTCRHAQPEIAALKDGYLVCNRLAEFMIPEADDDIIVSGHDSEWYVGPDFGCVHHEKIILDIYETFS